MQRKQSPSSQIVTAGARTVARKMDQDEYLSLCLMALAAACQQAGATAPRRPHDVAAPSSSASASSTELPLHFRRSRRTRRWGGHKASHSKLPAGGGAAPLFHQKEATAAASSASGSGGAGRHVCTVCRRGFDTGQALGGHKRFHYLHGPSVSASLPSGAVPSAVGGFDLNLAPLVPEIGFPGVRRRGDDDEMQSPLPLPPKKPRRPSNSA
ncbi:hypothetical protein C2845_PM04G31260 [Panicum miliaceum]|uniref:C2H2-type domain-containing protein n=1 Tax=Panicum miliaceum TaxID=4540 RepID=A0A3L6QLK7_PANMI|nr:hypothetical protein C2845_PM04G31260 [Panicum miliaceum]